MKILHIHPSMACGGIEAMICALSNEMAKTEDVTVCSIFKPLQSDSFWYKLRSNIVKKTLGKCTPGFSLRVLWDIYQFIKKGKYDIVNLHGMFCYYMFAVMLLHHNTKFFYTVHSDAVMENSVWDKRLFQVKRLCFARGWLKPITISLVSQESFTQRYNTSSTLIYNGIPRPIVLPENQLSKYRLSESTKVFIHVGRISVPKNQLVLVKVFQRLIDEGHDVVLLLAGPKQSNEIFTGISKYFGNRIVYLGQRDDACQLMAYSDAMCLPSIWEGLPVTLLEALSVGCVPICSNVGGIPDVIISGMNGFISKTYSEGDYYDSVKSFLDLSHEELLRLKDACKKTFDQYEITNTAKSYIDTYKGGSIN